MRAAAVIVAGGSGQRFGDAGKSFAIVGGMPMAWWSIMAANASEAVVEIVLVCGTHSQVEARAILESAGISKPVVLALGGARRQDSALAGTEATSSTIDVVAIHDAARPMVTADLFTRVIETAHAHGAAIAATPTTDTIKRVANETVIETLSRSELVSAQTPQAFRKAQLLDAFTVAQQNGTIVTDEASLIEATGGRVHVVPGSRNNLKVTYPEDINIVEALLGARTR